MVSNIAPGPDTSDRRPSVAPAAYYAEAASWDADVNGALSVSRRRAWWVASLATFVALLQALALALLMPLKTVVPYTITVDRQTGYAEAARGVDLGPMTENQALIQSALAQYVIARETIDATDLVSNYRKVGLWSTGQARRDYLAGMDRANPASILNSADASTQIMTTVKSIALLDATHALVRFATDRRDGEGPVARQDWAAVVGFGFSGAPLAAEDRLINPLGFQVSHYRRDSEGAPPPLNERPPKPAAMPGMVK